MPVVTLARFPDGAAALGLGVLAKTAPGRPALEGYVHGGPCLCWGDPRSGFFLRLFLNEQLDMASPPENDPSHVEGESYGPA